MSARDPRSPLRKEDHRLLTGRARFTDDVHLDRMVQGVFIRSPVAHAEITGIDASARDTLFELVVQPASFERRAL